jgi:hypothetical protein
MKNRQRERERGRNSESKLIGMVTVIGIEIDNVPVEEADGKLLCQCTAEARFACIASVLGTERSTYLSKKKKKNRKKKKKRICPCSCSTVRDGVPVPGGPCRSTTRLQEMRFAFTFLSEKSCSTQ